MEQILKNKRVAVLLADGFNQAHLTEIKSVLENAGATLVLISASTGTTLQSRAEDGAAEFFVDQPISNVCIDEYDALFLPGGKQSAQSLMQHDEAKQFIHGMTAQGSPIATLGEARELLVGVCEDGCPSFIAEADDAEAVRNAGQEILTLFASKPASEAQKHTA